MSKDKNFRRAMLFATGNSRAARHQITLQDRPRPQLSPDSPATVSHFGFEIIAKMQSIGAPRFWQAHHSNESLSMRASQRDCICIDPQAAQGAFTSD